MAKTKEEFVSKQLTITNARLSFCDLDEPRVFKDEKGVDSKPSYRARFIIPPGSENDRLIKKAIDDIAAKKWGADAKENLQFIGGDPKNICYWEGRRQKERECYDGNMILSARNYPTKTGAITKPQVRSVKNVVVNDKGVREAGPVVVGEDSFPYPGCHVNAVVELRAQDNTYGKAIRCKVLAVVFLKDGDPLHAGGAAIEDEKAFALSDGADAPELGDAA